MIDVGKLSEPATRLIEKISDAVAGIAKPWQIQRIAKAEAAAKITGANATIESHDLERRALRRWITEEAREQANIEQIVAKTIPLLTEATKPENISEDWLANFFEKCRKISDSEMQMIWAHLLTSEASSAGSFSRRTIDIVSQMDTNDAKLFKSLTGKLVRIGPIEGVLVSVAGSNQRRYELPPEIPKVEWATCDTLGSSRVGRIRQLSLPRSFVISIFRVASDPKIAWSFM